MFVNLELHPRPGSKAPPIRETIEPPENWPIPPVGESMYRDGTEYVVNYVRRRGANLTIRARQTGGKPRHEGSLRKPHQGRRR